MKDGDTAAEWLNLLGDLWKRTWEPFSKVSFVIYAFIGTILLGGLGIWTEVVRILLATPSHDLSTLNTAIGTFFPALVGSAALQLVFAAVNKSDKALIAFSWLVFCLFMAAAVLLALFEAEHPFRCLVIGALFCFGAVWFWWITNGNDPLYESIRPDAATGGSLNKRLSGNLNGFEA